MMNNVSYEIASTNNFFRHYLLGESVKNIFIRLTVILSAIILVWCGIMFALIIHTKCHRNKQMLQKSNTHHHLYDSNSSLKRVRQCHSSASSLSSTRCYSIRHILSELKRRCGFLPSSASYESSTCRTSSVFTFPKQHSESFSKSFPSTPTKVQLVVESMTKRSFYTKPNSNNLGKRISFYSNADSSSGDQLKTLRSTQNSPKSSIELSQSPVRLIEPKLPVHHHSVSFPLSETKDDHSSTKRLQKLHQFNTKATLFFHPITRRLSSANASLPSANVIQKQQQRKPLLMISSAGELSDREGKWSQTYKDEPIINNENRTASARHIPMVMITDTSSSNTNILELETFEDEHRLLGDVERRLSRELRASYRPRHST